MILVEFVLIFHDFGVFDPLGIILGFFRCRFFDVFLMSFWTTFGTKSISWAGIPSISFSLLKRAARIPPCQNVLLKFAFSLGGLVYWLFVGHWSVLSFEDVFKKLDAGVWFSYKIHRISSLFWQKCTQILLKSIKNDTEIDDKCSLDRFLRPRPRCGPPRRAEVRYPHLPALTLFAVNWISPYRISIYRIFPDLFLFYITFPIVNCLRFANPADPLVDSWESGFVFWLNS